jgi:HK97 family phage portal protein
MNILEKTLRGVGRLRAAYAQGLKAFPNSPMNDDRSWATYGGSYAYGSAGKGKRPTSTDDALEYFTSWTYVFSSIKAQAVAAIPLRTFGTIKTKGKKLKWAGTDVSVKSRPVGKARMKGFESSLALQSYITKAEDVEELIDYPLSDLLQFVNPFSSTIELLALTSLFLDLAGDAYWYLVKGKAGVPESIWLMPSQYVTPIPGKTLDTFIEAYEFTRGQKTATLPFEDVIKFSYPNPQSQIQGMSPVLGIADAVYNNSQMNIYEASLFENKARVDGLFEVDSTVPMAQVERAKEKFSAEFAGTQQAGKRPLLPPGMKFTKTSMTAEEISFIEGRRLSREEIAGGLNFPVALLDPNAIRANVEGGQYFLAKYGIEPIHSIIAGGINKFMVPMYDDSGAVFTAFDPCVPEDKDFQLRARQAGVGTPWISIDEARSEEGRDALEIEGVSDVPMISGMLMPLGEEAPEPEPPPASIIAPGKPDKDEIDEQADELAAKTWKKLKERLGA